MSTTQLPYRLPTPDAAISVAFLGQCAAIAPHLPPADSGELRSSVHDLRDGSDFAAVLADVERTAADLLVVFQPDLVPPGALTDYPGPVLGVALDTLPRAGRTSHESLDYNLAMLRRTDAANVDRMLLTDPLGFEAAAQTLPAWRCAPLPVADRHYREPALSRRPPRMLFLGHSTMHREQMLVDQKHRFDVTHFAAGLEGDELDEVLAAHDIGICLHNDSGIVGFPHTVLLHLAAGHLVLSEPLEPKFGLDPGIHLIEVGNRHDLDLRVHQTQQRPDAYDRVRRRGNHFAQQFRASLVWPRLVGDLIEDLRVFGTHRGN